MKGKEDVPEAAGFPPGGLSLEPVTRGEGSLFPRGSLRRDACVPTGTAA